MISRGTRLRTRIRRSISLNGRSIATQAKQFTSTLMNHTEMIFCIFSQPQLLEWPPVADSILRAPALPKTRHGQGPRRLDLCLGQPCLHYLHLMKPFNSNIGILFVERCRLPCNLPCTASVIRCHFTLRLLSVALWHLAIDRWSNG